MKTITLGQFEVMAQEIANNLVELDNFYVQVMKWSTNEKPQFDVAFYFKDWHAGGYADTPEKALEIAKKQYEKKLKEFEVTINY